VQVDYKTQKRTLKESAKVRREGGEGGSEGVGGGREAGVMALGW